MFVTLLFIVVILGVGFKVTTPEERAKLVQMALPFLRQAMDYGRTECEPFHDALRARTRFALMTPALVALNVVVFVGMLFGAGAFANPETLVGWGGNFGPRTTNGEWWRLATMMFVHGGMLHLVANMVGFWQPALILERLVGRFALASVYIAAGVIASLVSLATHPMGVSVGSSGAVFGVYGLLLASLVAGFLNRSDVTIPLMALKRLGPAAAVFLLYNLMAGGFERAQLAALITGFAGGLVLTRGVQDHKAPPRRVAASLAAAAVIVVAAAVPLRGVADVRPEIARVIAIEARTIAAYQTELDRFSNRRITGEGRGRLIDRTVRPELQSALTRLRAIKGVPQEHQPLVARADDYLRLRDDSWRLRAEGLRESSIVKLRQAERSERLSLEAFQKLSAGAATMSNE